MRYVGLDAHEMTSTIHILSERGEKLKSETIKGHWTKTVERILEQPGPVQVCFEASTSYGAIYDTLSHHCEKVAVAHPGHARLIFRSKRKNDRIDAEKLAKLLYLGEVPEVYVPGSQVRQWRRAITFRRKLVDEGVRVKNRLRNLLRTHGISGAPKSLWNREGLAWLAALELADGPALERDILIEDLQTVREKVRRVERYLDQRAACDPRVALLRTIPGVGPRTAEAVVAWIDRPDRFNANKTIGSYFGVVPCEDTSAGRARYGHITRQGPGQVRKLIVEAAWQAIRRSPRVRAYAKRLTHDDPDRRKIAIVATGHYLLRCMHAMLRDNAPWRE